MRNILVIKFGGTSLMTVDRIQHASQIVADTIASGKRAIVVVSAMGHTTDELIRLSDGITETPDRRELDALMATGEQVSATLMTMALQTLGLKARSFNGAQAGINTDQYFGNATIKTMNPRELTACLSAGIIPVVTGFQGLSRAGETTTLGRGGSDTTAIALAAAVQAERCDIYTDVDGIYSADPRIVKNANRLPCISVSEMLELSKCGAQVLNARSVELAQEKRVTVRVRSTFVPSDEGTLVTCEQANRHDFAGVAINANVNCIEIHLQRLEFGRDRRLSTFHTLRARTKRDLHNSLSQAGVTAEIVELVRPNPFRILLLVAKIDTVAALSAISKAELAIRDVSVSTDVASVSLVSNRITTKHLIETNDSLSRNNISIKAHAWRGQRLTVLVANILAHRTANIMHSQFARVRAVA